jgi:hypothetical protein
MICPSASKLSVRSGDVVRAAGAGALKTLGLTGRRGPSEHGLLKRTGKLRRCGCRGVRHGQPKLGRGASGIRVMSCALAVIFGGLAGETHPAEEQLSTRREGRPRGLGNQRSTVTRWQPREMAATVSLCNGGALRWDGDAAMCQRPMTLSRKPFNAPGALQTIIRHCQAKDRTMSTADLDLN